MPLSEAFIRRFGKLTEEYRFYNDEVILRYDVKNHVYLLVTPDGLVPQDGVTQTCHIIDKSEVLMNWAVKQMGQKLIDSMPKMTLPTGEVVIAQQKLEDFEVEVQKAKRAKDEKLEEAGNVGHIAHAWIENYIKAVLSGDTGRKEELLANLPKDDRAQNCCIAALDWMRCHNVRWISTERKIYSRQYGYAGTMDGLCLVDSCDDPQCCPKPFKDRLTVSDWKTSNYLYPEYRLQTAAYEYAYEEESGESVEDRWVIRLGKDDGKFDPWHLESECFSIDFKGFVDCLDLTRSIRKIKEDIDSKKAAERAEKKRVKDQAKAEEERAKEIAKSEKKAQLLAQKRVQCSKYQRYKGTRYPNCSPEGPCEACLKKYQERKCQGSSTALGKLLEGSRSSVNTENTNQDKQFGTVSVPVVR